MPRGSTAKYQCMFLSETLWNNIPIHDTVTASCYFLSNSGIPKKWTFPVNSWKAVQTESQQHWGKGEPGTEELRQEVARPQGISAHHDIVGHSVQNTVVPFTDSHSKATKMKETQPRAGGCQITECCSQEPAVALIGHKSCCYRRRLGPNRQQGPALPSRPYSIAVLPCLLWGALEEPCREVYSALVHTVPDLWRRKASAPCPQPAPQRGLARGLWGDTARLGLARALSLCGGWGWGEALWAHRAQALRPARPSALTLLAGAPSWPGGETGSLRVGCSPWKTQNGQRR